VDRDLSVRPLLEDHGWRVAIIGGVAALPFTTAAYMQTGNVSLTPVFFGGFLAGYLYDGQTFERSQVATRVGVIAALPALWMLFDALLQSWMDVPMWFQVVVAALLITVTALCFWLAAVVAMIGAWVGDWVSGTLS
jgi:hypothetical protein